MYKIKPKLPFQSAGHRFHSAAAYYSWQAVRRVAGAAMSRDSANANREAGSAVQKRQSGLRRHSATEFLKEVRVGFCIRPIRERPFKHRWPLHTGLDKTTTRIRISSPRFLLIA